MSGEENSLYKLCCQAVDMTLNQGTTLEGVTTDRILKNLKQLTNSREWSREFLFEDTAKHYVAIYLAGLNFRSGVKGKGVYFSEDSYNQIIREGLYINQDDLARCHRMKADELAVKVVKDGDGIPGQTYNDTVSSYEEMPLSVLVDEIKKIEKIEADAI